MDSSSTFFRVLVPKVSSPKYTVQWRLTFLVPNVLKKQSIKVRAGRLVRLNVFEKPLLNAFKEPVVCVLPYLFIKYLDFDRAAVAGCIYSLAQLSHCDDTVTHHGAAHQDAGQRDRPVGDVGAHDSATRTLDLLHYVWAPPNMDD